MQGLLREQKSVANRAGRRGEAAEGERRVSMAEGVRALRFALKGAPPTIIFEYVDPANRLRMRRFLELVGAHRNPSSQRFRNTPPREDSRWFENDGKEGYRDGVS